MLPDATYTVTLVSGSGTNGFLDLLGGGLDGAGNGGHANYTTTFTTNFQSSSNPVVAIPDFARGPDNTHPIQIPNNVSAGVPITLYNAVNVTNATFTVAYNSTILSITGALGGAGSDATYASSQFTYVSAAAGLATFTFHDTTPRSGTLVLGDVVATVPVSTPSKASYQVKDQLQIGNIVISPTPVNTPLASNGIHINSYFGDVTGDGNITGLDTLAANAVATGLATGFSAYKQLDPAIAGDVVGDYNVDAGDVSAIDSFVVHLSPMQIPAMPGLSGLSSPNAADPTLSLPSVLQADPDGIVSVPVLLDHPHPDGSTGMNEAILALTYDPSVLSLTAEDITLGSLPGLGTGWHLNSVVDAVTGQIGIELYSQTPITANQAGSLVNIAFRVQPGQSVAATSVQLVSGGTPNGQHFSTVLADSQGGLVLGEGLDRIVIQTGLEFAALSQAERLPAGAANGTQTAADVSNSSGKTAADTRNVLLEMEADQEPPFGVISNGAVAGETTAVHFLSSSLVVTGALAFQPNTASNSAVQQAVQSIAVGNIVFVNSLSSVAGSQLLLDRVFLPGAHAQKRPPISIRRMNPRAAVPICFGTACGKMGGRIRACSRRMRLEMTALPTALSSNREINQSLSSKLQ